MLRVYDHLPSRLMEVESRQLHEVLDGPSLFFLDGPENESIFISTLLHGNEPTGFEAIKKLVTEPWAKKKRLILFLGNIEAAKHGVRRLDDQPDYNRIWLGGSSPQEKMAAEVVERVTAEKPLAGVDIHNNTGQNPCYSCFNQPQKRHFSLASLFGDIIVYFTTPPTTATVCFSQYFPSTIIECGQTHEPRSLNYALGGLKRLWENSPDNWESFISTDRYYEVLGQMFVEANMSFNFGPSEDQLIFDANFDQRNFQMQKAGEVFAHQKNTHRVLRIVNHETGDLTDEFLQRNEAGEIIVQKDFVPSMLTLNKKIVRQDCLGYIMKTHSVEGLS